MTITVFAPNEPARIVHSAGRRFTLDEVRDLIGGYVEVVPLGAGRVALCDEEGRMKGLPPNPGASMLAGRPLVGTVAIGAVGVIR